MIKANPETGSPFFYSGYKGWIKRTDREGTIIPSGYFVSALTK